MGKLKSSSNMEEKDMFSVYEKSKPVQLVRVLVIALLCIVLIGSMAVFAVGITTHEVEYGSKQVAGLIGVVMYQVDSIMMIAVGAGCFLTIIIGLCAAIFKNKCLLGLHVVVLLFLSITLLVVGVLGYIFITELEDTVERSFENSIKKKYGVPKFSGTTESWNEVQSNFECCGAYGGINSSTSWAIYKKHSFWYKDGYANGSLVPSSCCGAGDMNMCMGRVSDYSGPAPYSGPPVFTSMNNLNYTLYTTGCYEKLHGYLVQNGILIGTVAIVVAVFLIIELSLSIFLHRKIEYLS